MTCVSIINFMAKEFFTLVEKAVLVKVLCSSTSSYSLNMSCQVNRISKASNIEIYKDF